MSELVVNYRYQRDVVERAHAIAVRRDSDFTVCLTGTQFVVYLGQCRMKTRSFGGFQYREELTVLLGHHFVGQISFKRFNESICNRRTSFNDGRFARRVRCGGVCVQNNWYARSIFPIARIHSCIWNNVTCSESHSCSAVYLRFGVSFWLSECNERVFVQIDFRSDELVIRYRIDLRQRYEFLRLLVPLHVAKRVSDKLLCIFVRYVKTVLRHVRVDKFVDIRPDAFRIRNLCISFRKNLVLFNDWFAVELFCVDVISVADKFRVH